MIPKLYQKDGTTLIGVLTNCIECLVEEERNGIFEVTFQYPNTESIATSLVYDNIVICDANDTLKNQKFRIYDTRRMMNNTIEVYARHISFDLAYDYINSIDITNQSCEYALNTIFRNTQFSTKYVGHSDIINAQNYKISNCNALEAIAGKQGSIIDTYGTGAEILRDNTNIYVYNKRGNDNEVSIEYAKNLTGFELQENTDDLITRILPYATYTPEGGTQTRVDGPSCDSQYINNYSHPFIAEIDFSDKFEDGVVPTASKLQTLAEQYFNNNKCDLPKQNWKIEFIPLSKCVGYESIEDAISLCDTVTIKDTRYNINTKAKVIKTVYDVLRERYDSMELGEPRTTLGDIVNTGNEKGEQGPPGPQGPKGEDGNIGDFPDSVPAKPVLTITLLGFASIQLDWTYDNKPYYWYEVYASKTKDFTPNLFDIIHKGQTSSFLFQAKPGETWYFRVCGVNSYDHRSEFSDQIEVITTKVDNLSNYFTTAAIGSAVVGSLTADYMTAGIIKGDWIDAKNLSVTDGNGKRTLDIDSFGNVNLDVTSLKISSNDVVTKTEFDNKFANYSTTTQMNSAINQKANEITNTVSKTYTSKAEFNNLAVGGRNLFRFSSAYLIGEKDISKIWYSVRGNMSKETSNLYNGKEVYKLTCTAATTASQTTSYTELVSKYKSMYVESGKEYTLSGYYTPLLNCKGIKFTLYTVSNDSTVATIYNTSNTSTSSNEVIYFNTTWTSTYTGDVLMTIFNKGKINDTDGDGALLFNNIKFEKGNKATDWTPAPEDIDEKFTNYSTTKQMNSAIDQKADEITSTVSSTYTTKTELDNLSIGGRNLIKNSNFIYDKRDWSFSSYASIDTTRVYNNSPSAKISVSNQESYSSRGINQQFIVNAYSGEEYTVSLWYYVQDKSIFDEDVYIEVDGKPTGGSYFSANVGRLVLNRANLITGTWTRVTFTFKLSSNYDALRFRAYVWLNGTIWITNIQVEKGNKVTDWTPALEDFNENLEIVRSEVSTVSQTASSLTTEVSKKLNSDELSSRIQQSATDIRIGFNGIYNYISISDSMGIRVNHTDGSYSRINEDGFLYYNSGSTNRYHSLHAAGTLQLTGSGENEKFTITLPSSFSNVSASDIILILSMDGPRFYASPGVYYTEYYSVSNWIDASWRKDYNGNWSTDEVSAHYRVYNTQTKSIEYAKAYISYVVLA